MSLLVRRLTRTASLTRHVRLSFRLSSTVSPMKTGTELYMSLYPEGSTDGGLRLGNVVPDFKAETTHGTWESFHGAGPFVPADWCPPIDPARR